MIQKRPRSPVKIYTWPEESFLVQRLTTNQRPVCPWRVQLIWVDSNPLLRRHASSAIKSEKTENPTRQRSWSATSFPHLSDTIPSKIFPGPVDTNHTIIVVAIIIMVKEFRLGGFPTRSKTRKLGLGQRM